jgi:hypothetical protein
MKYCFFLLCCLHTLIANTQSSAESALKKFETNYPTEKIYLQYNKSSFIAGETMWFKCYTFSGNIASPISTNLYVELYDDQKNVIEKRIVPLIKGAGEGSFTLDKNLNEGVYYIRAYTLWSLNFDADFPYLHQFNLYNPNSPYKLTLKQAHWSAGVYPESGRIINGIKNKVAIRLTADGSLPLEWKGRVIDKEDAKEIISFSSHTPEIGSFEFIPLANKRYQVELSDNFGNVKLVPLPDAVPSANLLQVHREQNQIVCKISFQNEGASSYQLIGQMHNQLVYKATVGNTNKEGILIKIPVDKLTDGILHLTLFDDKGIPVAGRLSFVKIYGSSTDSIKIDTIATAKRGLNHLSFLADTASYGTYTILVEDGFTVPPTENIISRMLLTGDINRMVHEPAAYFANTTESADALDALLLTCKWRWFDWRSIIAGRYPEIKYKPDNYLSFTGAVFLGRKLQLNKPLNLIYQLADSTLLFHQARTDSSGAFYISNAIFYDTANLYYQLDSKRAGANAIKVIFEANNPFPKFTGVWPAHKYMLLPRPENDTLSEHLKMAINALHNQTIADNRYLVLQAVTVRAKANKKQDALNRKLSSPAFQSVDEIVLDLTNNENFIGSISIVDYIKQTIAGLQTFPLYRNSVLGIYIDEMKSNVIGLQTLPITDIAMVKFLRTGNVINGNPLLLVYTKRGDSSRAPFYGMPFSKIVGYRSPAPFPFVDYANELYNKVELDSRSLLYWNTSPKPDSSGKVSIRFHNNDISQTFKATVVGLKSDGRPFVLERIFGQTTSNIKK